jgi:hypothetical protein
VVDAERNHLGLGKNDEVAGVALTGGGIRSASFCLGVLLFLFGLLVLADQLVLLLIDSGIAGVFWWHLSAAAFVVISAAFVPINKVSIHRYYRDRLMELFNPDVLGILGGMDVYLSCRANVAGVQNSSPLPGRAVARNSGLPTISSTPT